MRSPRDARFAAAWFRADAELRERMGGPFDAAGTWRERLRASVAAGLSFLAEDPQRARLYIVDALFAGGDVRAARQRTLDCFGEMIAAGRTEAAVSVPPRIVGIGVAGGVWHRVYGLLREGRVAELPADLPQIMYFAVMPYLGADAAQEELERPFLDSP